MKAICPDCAGDIEVTVTNQGRSSDGKYERAVIEASHAPVAEGQTPCSWVTQSDAAHDLVALAAAAK